MNELISVIIPVYNADKFLERCIESILKQTYPYFEMLLIDDGSTDDSANICNIFAQKDSRIHYYYQENAGVSSARNKGLENAKGRYITFVDADDWIENKYLEVLISGIKKKRLVLCAYKVIKGNCTVLIHEEKLIGIKNVKPFFEESNDVINDPGGIIESCNVKGFVWRCLFLKKLIDKQEIRFHTKVSLSEDLLFMMQYINYIEWEEISYIEEYLYNYVQHSDSACSKKYKLRLYENRKVVNKLIEKQILESKGIDIEEKLNIIEDLKYSAIYEVLSNEKEIGTIKKYNLHCKKYYKDGMANLINMQCIKKLINSNEYKKVFILLLYKLKLYSIIYLLYKVCKTNPVNE